MNKNGLETIWTQDTLAVIQGRSSVDKYRFKTGYSKLDLLIWVIQVETGQMMGQFQWAVMQQSCPVIVLHNILTKMFNCRNIASHIALTEVVPKYVSL